MRQLKSCGIILFQKNPHLQFLLLKNGARYGIPKGHQETGESETETALRELAEETGILAHHIQLDPQFRFETTYQTPYKRFNNEMVEKSVVIFLGWLLKSVELKLTEHDAFEWIQWNPPHSLQAETIDPLLDALAKFWQ